MKDTVTFFDVDTADRKGAKCTVEVTFLWGVHDLKKVQREFEGKGYLDLVDRMSQLLAIGVSGVIGTRTK